MIVAILTKFLGILSGPAPSTPICSILVSAFVRFSPYPGTYALPLVVLENLVLIA